MKTELKDVEHLYLGSDCLVKFPSLEKAVKRKITPALIGVPSVVIEWWKPILRPLLDNSHVTKEEYKYIWEELNTTAPVIHINMKMEPKLFVYLLKQGFDIFGLIESGQAIDKTTLKP